MNLHLNRFFAVLVSLLAIPVLSHAQYSATHEGDVVRLTDSAHQTSVAIDSAVGNVIFEMTVKGQNIIYFPSATPEEFKAHPRIEGIPVLAPWANRLDEQAFYANGKKYAFNMTLGNVRGATPIHGLVSQATSWQIVEVKADKNSAWLTSRLDFYKNPDWMAQFPFAHTIEITQRLHDGMLEVHTKIDNLSTDPMPVAVGFHPYFRLTDSGRADWTISAAAGTHYLLQPNKIPTGETEPITSEFKDPAAAPLKDYNLDDVFGELKRGADGRALFSVSGKHQKITVEFGPKFQAAVIFSPNPNAAAPPPANAQQPARPAQDPNFVCFEPMAGITDAINLAHAGKYSALQSIAPGGSWEESFWVVPSGF
jgi:aldose 1-epimerase